MITGEEVLEALGKKGVDFVGELHPYDRKQIEDHLDYEIEMASSLSEDIDDAISGLADEVIDRLKHRVTEQLERLCDSGDINLEQVNLLETAIHSEITDVVRDEQTSALGR